MTVWNRINKTDRTRHERHKLNSITVYDKPFYERGVKVKTKEKEFDERTGEEEFIYIEKPPKIRTLG